MCDVVCGFLASTEADKMTIMLDNMEYQVLQAHESISSKRETYKIQM